MNLKSCIILLATLLTFFAFSTTNGAKILAIFSFPGRSQYIFAEKYLKTLAARGHEITVINTFGSKEQAKNFRVIGATKVHELMGDLMKNYNPNANQWQILDATTQFLNLLSQNIFDTEEVQKLLQSNEKFDLLLAECVQNEVLFGFAQHFDALTIGFSSYGTDTHIDTLMGNISPLSYNPMLLSSRTDHMNFRERLENLCEATIAWLHKYLVHLPSQRELYGKYFPTANIAFDKVLDSFSLVLLGQHFTLSYARPYVPNMIEVGGMHLNEQNNPLPQNIEKFINESTHGVIYFSMGSNIQSKDLPAATRDTLLKVFGTLKQRVLWKFEDDQLPGKPNNVFISKWFPQPDILAHKNVKLFITHGGLLSTIESIYYGKPVLGLPMVWDQFLNVERARHAGYGLGLTFQTLTEETLKDSLEKLLNDKSYTQAVQRMSTLYRDQKESALERAIWWTEYVLRNKGAKHMRVAAKDLNFMQLHSLDTIGTLFGGIAFVVLLILLLVYKLVALIRVKCFTRSSDKLKKQ